MTFMMHFHRRQRKPLAAMVIGCWLFALFVSVANACGFNADLAQTARAEAMAMSGQPDTDESGSPACKQFCADDLPVLAKIKLVQDQASAQALPVSPLSVAPVLAGGLNAVPPLRSRQPPPGIALNIRFVRLAL